MGYYLVAIGDLFFKQPIGTTKMPSSHFISMLLAGDNDLQVWQSRLARSFLFNVVNIDREICAILMKTFAVF